MGDFELYFRMGIEHITDRNGYDHMLFLVTLCAAFPPKAWKRVLVLATAFTVDHSITLALTAFGYRIIDAETVEVLIPITIFLCALYNLFFSQEGRRMDWGAYILALSFGLIHGMGFAGFFSEMLSGIREDIVLPLLYFNLGLEAGQVVIVAIFLVVGFLVMRFTKLPQRRWTQGVSALGALLSLWLLVSVLS